MAEKKTLRPGEFEHPALGCKFSLPEKFTARTHQAWVDAREAAKADGATSALAVNWIGAIAIIDEWECETLPNHLDDLDEICNEQLAVIKWVGDDVAYYIITLLSVPKN
jgi:uncharacterized protein (DUF1684 family)